MPREGRFLILGVNVISSDRNTSAPIPAVTAGHNGGGPANAYPHNFMEWLNARYPCRALNGTAGAHEHEILYTENSQVTFSYWNSLESIDLFDLVFLEFNVGDSFIKSIPHALEDKVPAGSPMKTPPNEYIMCFYFEAVLRRLLLLRKPDPVAVVIFNADYRGRDWAFPPWTDPVVQRKTMFKGNYEPLKLWVSSMYEVPIISAVAWMLPLAGKMGGPEMQFNRTLNPYNTGAWHADVCCHPKPPGHLLLSLVMAYCFVEEERMMLAFGDAGAAEGERDYTMEDPPTLRDPIYLSPDEDRIYIKGDQMDNSLDFTDPSGQQSWEGKILAKANWTWYADNKDKDKYGLIADGVLGGQHMAISLRGGRIGRVEVSFVVSYENFGVALAWLDDSVENAHEENLCKEVSNYPKAGVKRLVAIWNLRASVPTMELLDDEIKEGDEKILHLCLTPRDDGRKGPGNRFKLLGVRVY